MKYPDKWRETIDPFTLPYNSFKLKEVMGYPHAGNDVFYVRGIHDGKEVTAFIKAARQKGSDICREIEAVRKLKLELAPQIIDCDSEGGSFIVTLEKPGRRLSAIVGDNKAMESMDYMFEYGKTLAQLHTTDISIGTVKDRRFFHVPSQAYLEKQGLDFVHSYLTENVPKKINTCFCHGDFHYANVLWENGKMSAILDFELSGMGNREFDIAWALCLRPGQRFLNTKAEISHFLEGYESRGEFDLDSVKYYMMQIYSYFYTFEGNESEYLEYIMQEFKNLCI